jgi:hypothetical protein
MSVESVSNYRIFYYFLQLNFLFKRVNQRIRRAGFAVHMILIFLGQCLLQRSTQIRIRMYVTYKVVGPHTTYSCRHGASVARSWEQAPFTSEIMGSIFAADLWHFVKRVGQLTLYRKSWAFSGHSHFLPRWMLKGWVGINPYVCG